MKIVKLGRNELVLKNVVDLQQAAVHGLAQLQQDQPPLELLVRKEIRLLRMVPQLGVVQKAGGSNPSLASDSILLINQSSSCCLYHLVYQYFFWLMSVCVRGGVVKMYNWANIHVLNLKVLYILASLSYTKISYSTCVLYSVCLLIIHSLVPSFEDCFIAHKLKIVSSA